MDHTAELFKACGIAILAAISLNLLGRAAGGVGVSLRIGGSVLIFGVLAVVLKDNVDVLRDSLLLGEQREGSVIGEAFSLMLKALGVALVSRFCADICRDCGENTLANGVESVGRVVMVSLSLPMFAEILRRVSEILDLAA